MKNRFFLLVMGAVLLTSCKDKENLGPAEENLGNYVNIQVQPMFNVENLHLDSVYTTQEGYKIKFTDIKFFVEDIKNGSAQLIDAGLFDYRERGTLLARALGNGSNFMNFSGNLGVRSAINHNDPTTFPNSSMLNITNTNDMHWNWSPGYIFVKIEAKADTIPDATTLLNHNIVFHAGSDVNLQTLSFTNITWDKVGNEETFRLKLDMAKFLHGTQTINVKDEFSTHSTGAQAALTLKVMENFKEALEPY
ncbi:MAG: hypothetical protein QNL61_06265 [Crocinitomicaceae bacterium]